MAFDSFPVAATGAALLACGVFLLVLSHRFKKKQSPSARGTFALIGFVPVKVGELYSPRALRWVWGAGIACLVLYFLWLFTRK